MSVGLTSPVFTSLLYWFTLLFMPEAWGGCKLKNHSGGQTSLSFLIIVTSMFKFTKNLLNCQTADWDIIEMLWDDLKTLHAGTTTNVSEEWSRPSLDWSRRLINGIDRYNKNLPVISAQQGKTSCRVSEIFPELENTFVLKYFIYRVEKINIFCWSFVCSPILNGFVWFLYITMKKCLAWCFVLGVSLMGFWYDLLKFTLREILLVLVGKRTSFNIAIFHVHYLHFSEYWTN